MKKSPADAETMINENLSALLRMKRYELPPADYHDDFLLEFQRRQRLSALRPSWKERWQDAIERIWPDFRVPSFAYGAVGLAAVVFSAWILSVEELPTSAPSASTLAAAEMPSTDQGALRLQINSDWREVLPQPVNIPAQRTVGTLPPHYALQARPNAEQEPFRF